ncbi:hypothetical protein [Catellatospora sp. NPDC049609]|uniref:hypothetical protein n=1 Tax=Catellatospora sp. NPDC049609 TaxID=3155505 RepID=UPI003431E116
MGERILGADGRQWRVRRRWLPWRPTRWGGDADGFETTALSQYADSLGCLIALLVLAFPVLLLLLFAALEWLLLLLLLPLWTLARVVFGVPWVVQARGRSAEGRRWRYHGEARGWQGSADLIAAVREEIRVHGEPRSLGPGLAEEQDPADPVGDGEWLARVQAGEPMEVHGHVYGTTSAYARNGWLAGWIRADAESLSIAQPGGTSRRVIPVRGGSVPPDEPSTKADRAAIGASAVIGVIGTDGRWYRIAVEPDDIRALRWLRSQWTAPH